VLIDKWLLTAGGVISQQPELGLGIKPNRYRLPGLMTPNQHVLAK
jgi:hypothetical protein